MCDANPQPPPNQEPADTRLPLVATGPDMSASEPLKPRGFAQDGEAESARVSTRPAKRSPSLRAATQLSTRGKAGRVHEQALIRRVHEQALIRRLMKETFMKSRPTIEVALGRRFTNPATVQDMVELLARLEGELP